MLAELGTAHWCELKVVLFVCAALHPQAGLACGLVKRLDGHDLKSLSRGVVVCVVKLSLSYDSHWNGFPVGFLILREHLVKEYTTDLQICA